MAQQTHKSQEIQSEVLHSSLVPHYCEREIKGTMACVRGNVSSNSTSRLLLTCVITLTFYKQGTRPTPGTFKKRNIFWKLQTRKPSEVSQFLGIHSKSLQREETDKIAVKITAFLASQEINNYSKEILLTYENRKETPEDSGLPANYQTCLCKAVHLGNKSTCSVILKALIV